MTEVRYRVSWQLAIAILLVVTIAVVPVIVYFLDWKNIFLYVMATFIGWTVWILIALMGAFFLGLAVGHRTASKAEFTPFEVEMMKMKEEVKLLKELLHRHNIHHQDGDKGAVSDEEPGPKPGPAAMGDQRPRPGTQPEKPALVEVELEPRSITEGSPEMKPVGRVKCSKCGTIIPLYKKERPLEVRCTNCGKVGVLR